VIISLLVGVFLWTLLLAFLYFLRHAPWKGVVT